MRLMLTIAAIALAVGLGAVLFLFTVMVFG